MPYALLLLLLAADAAHAAVYKCVVAGQARYSDRPCDKATPPAVLPPINTMPRTAGDDLGQQHDQRLSRDKAARDLSDAAFVKAHAAKTERDKAVRAAIIEHRVMEGMTPSEVESALGSADDQRPDGLWLYRREGRRITVRFKAGIVAGVSTTSEKK